MASDLRTAVLSGIMETVLAEIQKPVNGVRTLAKTIGAVYPNWWQVTDYNEARGMFVLVAQSLFTYVNSSWMFSMGVSNSWGTNIYFYRQLPNVTVNNDLSTNLGSSVVGTASTTKLSTILINNNATNTSILWVSTLHAALHAAGCCLLSNVSSSHDAVSPSRSRCTCQHQNAAVQPSVEPDRLGESL